MTAYIKKYIQGKRGHCFVTALIAMTIVIFATAAFAQQTEATQFPYLAKINTDDVNVRAGGDQNFETLSKVNSGAIVLVVEKNYSWYKILLPEAAHCYVSADFIESDGTTYSSKASRLNLRARPNTESSIVGQLVKGEKIVVLGQAKEGWYEIKPTKNCYGWVKSGFADFYSQDQKEIDKIISAREVTNIVPAKPQEKVISPTAQGEIKRMGFSFKRRPGTHKLVRDQKTDYYLKSDKYDLDDFLGQTCSIWGEVITGESDKPLLYVDKIESAK